MKRGLGKGLEALLGESTSSLINDSSSKNGIESVRVNEIEPNTNQPRKRFDEDSINELCESIKRHGIVQPIIVRIVNGTYKIVVGERRWRAAKKAGLKEIPVLKKEMTDRQVMEVALIENLQREDLNVIEEANAYSQLIEEYNMTHNDLAEAIGKSRVDITNKLRLLKLPNNVIRKIENSEITAGHARALLSLDTEKEINDLAEEVILKQLSVRQTEVQVKRKKNKDIHEKKRAFVFPEIFDLQNRMTKYFETKVKIITRKKGSKIVIDCPSDDILNSIIEKLEV